MLRARPGRSSVTALPRPAPYAAVRAELVDSAPLTLTLTGRGLLLRAVYDGEHCRLELDGMTGPVVLRSRRAGRVEAAASLALCLTGTHVSVLTQDHPGGPWTGRARTDLAGTHPAAARLVRTAAWLEDLQVGHDGRALSLVAGGFGQLGLRDLRLVTHADGRPYDDGTGLLRFLATSAGPGPFGSGHTSVWALDPSALDQSTRDHSARDHDGEALVHTADLYVRRLDSRGVQGDHAGHLLRDDDAWLLATSTWGDFDPDRDDAAVAVTLAATGADLLTGVHVVAAEPLPLPVDGPSVGVWDPHLLRTDDGWLVGYVSASRFFRFHPVLAEGPDLDTLRLRAADPGRRASEGTTLLALPPAAPDEDPRGGGEPGDAAGSPRTTVLVSDGRDGPRGLRGQWAVLDLDLRPRGVLAAAYPSNIPWPTLVPHGDDWLLVTFDDTRHGGRVCGYGTHGDVVVMRGSRPAS
ncbi:hypothetical protein NOMA109596_18480 [Nocardioides marinus]|uniref:Uncharacterized protein n=1 Tax=Nocardioides marinus TaxID=374514 RepID=A0A7Y9YI50_9ACTN|nr:hypothetical protein [Nocardioides marinus]